MSQTLRERALRILARRDHTRVELRGKLAGDAGSRQELDTLLDDLIGQGLLSDERYATARLHSRAPRYGDARLACELRAKGVDDEVISQALASGEDEFTRARQVWQRKYGFPAKPVTDPTEIARQTRFLAGRGFSSTTIRRLLRGAVDDDR